MDHEEDTVGAEDTDGDGEEEEGNVHDDHKKKFGYEKYHRRNFHQCRAIGKMTVDSSLRHKSQYARTCGQYAIVWFENQFLR